MQLKPATWQEAQALSHALSRANGFLKAKHIISIAPIKLTARKIRSIVETYPHMFFSTTAGFKRISDATPDELSAAIGQNRSRVIKLARKCKVWEREMNKKLHPNQTV
tara:strand:- start:1232 stop:1555 length:324 start_codon:yes stop_codon:yes gene_type:complete